MKRKNIIIGCAAVAVLIIGIIVLLTINPDEDNSPKNIAAENEIILELETADEILLDTESFDINFINNGGNWYIKGLESKNTASAKVKAFVFAALSYSSNTLLNGEDSSYGLDKPTATITIKAEDGEHIVKIGNVNAAGDECFASVDDRKFAMALTQRDRLMKDMSYYTQFARISIKADDITSILIENADRAIELYVPEVTRFEGNVWRMKKPYELMANDTFIDSDVLPSLEAVTLSRKADSFGDLSSKVTVIAGNDEYVFRIGSVTDGYAAVEYKGEVYAEPAKLFAFADAETFEFMHKLVSYVNINDVNAVTMEYGDTSHTLEIDGDKFFADSEAANADAGKYFYTFLIGVVANGMYNEEPLGERMLKLTFDCKNNEKITVEYCKINEYTTAVIKNGEAVFVTGVYDVEELIEKIDTFYM